MAYTPDHWSQGYIAAINGASYDANPYAGQDGATAWAFGCAQGMRDRNSAAFGRIIDALRQEVPA